MPLFSEPKLECADRYQLFDAYHSRVSRRGNPETVSEVEEECEFVDAIPSSLLNDYPRRAMMFDTLTTEASREPSTPSLTAPERKRIVIGVEGEREAFLAISNASSAAVALTPSPLQLHGIVIAVLLYVPVHEATLFAVAQVCRCWRIAASRLPQWSVLARLCRMSDPTYIRCLSPLAVCFPSMQEAQRMCKSAVNFEEVRSVMRWRAECLVMARLALVTPFWDTTRGLLLLNALQFVVGLVGCLVALGIAFGLGWVAPQNAQLQGDSKLGPAAWFASAPVMPIATAVLYATHRVFRAPPLTEQNRRRHGASATVAVAMVTVIALSLAVPSALLAARLSEARAMAAVGPPLIYGSPGQCAPPLSSLDAAQVPYAVGIDDPWAWRLLPFNTLNPTAAQIAGCGLNISTDPLNQTSHFFADAIANMSTSDTLSCGTDADSDQCTVYLWPPPSGVCDATPPIAVACDPSSMSALVATTASFWVSSPTLSGGAPERPTWFRTTRPSVFFPPSVTTGAPANASSGRRLIMLPVTSESMAELADRWGRNVLIIPILLIAVVCSSALVCVLGFVRASFQLGTVYSGALVFAGCNPFIAVGFATACTGRVATHEYCMLSASNAEWLDGTGITAGIAWCLGWLTAFVVSYIHKETESYKAPRIVSRGGDGVRGVV